MSLCRVHHLQAHGRGWTLAVEPATAAVTGHRHGRRRWTTHPPATPLAQPTSGHANRHAHDDGADGRDPPEGDHSPEEGDPPADDAFLDHHGNPLPF